MVERQTSRDQNEQRPRWVLALAVIVPLAMAALLVMVFTVTVQADAPLARPASTQPPAAPPEALTPLLATRPTPATRAARLRGLASWYGEAFDGRITASGERFDMNAMTACDNRLPFGTIVRVINLKNHRSVVVRINDRGLLMAGRIIDLSYAAAEKLNFTDAGLAPVKLEVLSLGESRNN